MRIETSPNFRNVKRQPNERPAGVQTHLHTNSFADSSLNEISTKRFRNHTVVNLSPHVTQTSCSTVGTLMNDNLDMFYIKLQTLPYTT